MIDIILFIMAICSLICFLIALGISCGLTVGWFVYLGFILICPTIIYFTIESLKAILPTLKTKGK